MQHNALFIEQYLIIMFIIFIMFKQIIQTILPIQFTYLVHCSNFACQPTSSENSYRIEPLKKRGLVWNAQ